MRIFKEIAERDLYFLKDVILSGGEPTNFF